LADTVYEGLFILDSNKYARDPSAVSSQIPAIVESLGGEMLVSRLWAEQKLAYPIDGHRKGTYWLSYFRLESTNLGELNEQTRLNDSVLRSLVIKIDPRLVDLLVQHATGEGSTDDAETSESSESDGGAGEGAESEKAEAVPAG